MCRNIKLLYNFEPATTDEEIRAAAIQFVRKVSGFNKPSAANSDAFEAAIEEISAASRKLLASLVTASAAARPQGRTRKSATTKSTQIRRGERSIK